MKIAHIIKVLEIKPKHESCYLHLAQPITVASMIAAKNNTRSDIEIDLVAVKHQSEKLNLPADFIWAKDLNRWCADIFNHLPKEKELPFIADILNALYNASDADYLIYTNVDIGLFPNFYDHVKQTIDAGFDSFIINRLNMPKSINNITIGPENYNLLFNCEGTVHGGFDCFVFRREYLPQLILGNVFIGAAPIGSVLQKELSRLSSKMKIFKSHEKLTFHVGADLDWQNPENPNWIQNILEARKIGYNFPLPK